MNDMSRPRASRLSQPRRRTGGFLADRLPYGSLARKLVLHYTLPLVIIILGVLIVDKVIMPTITRQGSAFRLPDFTSQRLLEARISLDNLELKYEISSEEFSPGKPHGVILQQFPKQGTKVKPGRTVKFIVSLGQKMVMIPQVGGKSVRQAMLDLETSGLMLGEIAWALSDTIPERIVVFSYPSAGTEIPFGTPVNLMVNRGRAQSFTYMPLVTGMTLDEAVKRLEDKLLQVGIVSYRADELYLPETVLEQSESQGTELDVATEIDLVVSST